MSQTLAPWETRLIERAMNQQWPIKPEYRQAIVNHLMTVILDPSYSERHKATAIRSMMQADAENRKDAANQQVDERGNRLLEIAIAAGLPQAPQRIPEGNTVSNLSGDGANAGSGVGDREDESSGIDGEETSRREGFGNPLAEGSEPEA